MSPLALNEEPCALDGISKEIGHCFNQLSDGRIGRKSFVVEMLNVLASISH